MENDAVNPVAMPRVERRSPGMEGVLIFIFGDMLVFALFFGMFAHALKQDPALFAESQKTLDLHLALTNVFVLLLSSGLVVAALKSVRRDHAARAFWLLSGAFFCGAIFAALKFIEYNSKFEAEIFPTTNEFFMYYFVLTGVHFFHVVIGMIVLLFMMRRAYSGEAYSGPDIEGFESGAIYWHMVDLLWVILVPLVYLMRWGNG